jgi:hypothetical protein
MTALFTMARRDLNLFPFARHYPHAMLVVLRVLRCPFHGSRDLRNDNQHKSRRQKSAGVGLACKACRAIQHNVQTHALAAHLQRTLLTVYRAASYITTCTK